MLPTTGKTCLFPRLQDRCTKNRGKPPHAASGQPSQAGKDRVPTYLEGDGSCTLACLGNSPKQGRKSIGCCVRLAHSLSSSLAAARQRT